MERAPTKLRERFRLLDAILVRWEAYGALLSQYGIDPTWVVNLGSEHC